MASPSSPLEPVGCRTCTFRHESQHFYWSGDTRVEEVMGYQGVCYCHAQGSCIEWVLHLHLHLLLHILCSHLCTCSRPESLCNCDAAATAWTYDDGQLTDRGWVPTTSPSQPAASDQAQLRPPGGGGPGGQVPAGATLLQVYISLPKLAAIKAKTSCLN